jgi:hypothetical protein
LFGKVNAALGHAFVDGFFGTPINGQLEIVFFFGVGKVVNLVFGQDLLFYRREITAEAFDVNAQVQFRMGNDGNKTVGVGDADLNQTVRDERLSVVVVAQIDFFREDFIQERANCQFFFSSGFALEEHQFFLFIVGNRITKLS